MKKLIEILLQRSGKWKEENRKLINYLNIEGEPIWKKTQHFYEMLKRQKRMSFSKSEAFTDLYDLASDKDQEIERNGKEFKLRPGEFFASVTELSERWNWNRAKVRTFLDGLEELGELDIHPYYRGNIFTLLKYDLVTEFTSGQDNLPNVNIFRINKTDEQIAKISRQYTDYFQELSQVLTPDELLKHQTEQFAQTFLMLAASVLDEIKSSSEIGKAVDLSLGREVWDWNKLLFEMYACKEQIDKAGLSACIHGSVDIASTGLLPFLAWFCFGRQNSESVLKQSRDCDAKESATDSSVGPDSTLVDSASNVRNSSEKRVLSNV